jgi:hypothetical protein
MSQVMAAIEPDGLPWVAYPKRSSGVKVDIDHDTRWKATEPTDWRPVRQVPIDDVWPAIRFRPGDRVGR